VVIPVPLFRFLQWLWIKMYEMPVNHASLGVNMTLKKCCFYPYVAFRKYPSNSTCLIADKLGYDDDDEIDLSHLYSKLTIKICVLLVSPPMPGAKVDQFKLMRAQIDNDILILKRESCII
jgi:hypothetical protein